MRLDASCLRVQRGGRDILHDVSFTAAAGAFIGLVGPNGAGKSTLLAALAGLLPFNGAISYQGKPVQRLYGKEQAQTLAYLPQEREISWNIRADRVVALGLEALRAPFAPWTKSDDQQVAAALAALRLTDLAAREAKTLSGGEKARLLLARALVQNAAVLLADEPIAGLDPAHQWLVMQALKAVADGGGVVIASLHDLPVAARWCNRLAVMDQGRIVADGAPQETLTPALLRRVYHMEAEVRQTPHGLTIETTGLSAPE